MPKLRLIAGSQLVLSVLLLCGVWIGLPARWLWVDLPGTGVALAAATVAFGLWRQAVWAPPLARVLLWSELLLGSLVVTLLAMSAAQLAGSYGPVGAGGAMLMGAVALLILPYLVIFPALQLAWLREPS
jgi:hypothetical protein